MGKLTEILDYLNRPPGQFYGMSHREFFKLFYSHVEFSEALKKRRREQKLYVTLKNSAKKQENNV